MSHFAVVLCFYFTIEVEVSARVFCDVGLSLFHVLAEDVEHNGWGMEVYRWQGLTENASDMGVKL